MRNVWIILRKELRSYFVSPVAYLLLVSAGGGPGANCAIHAWLPGALGTPNGVMFCH